MRQLLVDQILHLSLQQALLVLQQMSVILPFVEVALYLFFKKMVIMLSISMAVLAAMILLMMQEIH